jgi:hypothetical protein
MLCVMLHCERDNATSMQQQLLPELSGPRVLIFSLLVVPLDKTRQDPVVLPLDLARASCARTASHAPASPCTLAGRPIQTPYCRSPYNLQRKEKNASFVSVGPCACPEPVLAKKAHKTKRFPHRHTRSPCTRRDRTRRASHPCRQCGALPRCRSSLALPRVAAALLW